MAMGGTLLEGEQGKQIPHALESHFKVDLMFIDVAAQVFCPAAVIFSHYHVWPVGKGSQGKGIAFGHGRKFLCHGFVHPGCCLDGPSHEPEHDAQIDTLENTFLPGLISVIPFMVFPCINGLKDLVGQMADNNIRVIAFFCQLIFSLYFNGL